MLAIANVTTSYWWETEIELNDYNYSTGQSGLLYRPQSSPSYFSYLLESNPFDRLVDL